MMATKGRREWLAREVAAQEKWIAEHGENLPGYIAHYGSASDPCHYGNGGEAIYAADMNALTELRAALRQVGGS